MQEYCRQTSTKVLSEKVISKLGELEQKKRATPTGKRFEFAMVTRRTFIPSWEEFVNMTELLERDGSIVACGFIIIEMDESSETRFTLWNAQMQECRDGWVECQEQLLAAFEKVVGSLPFDLLTACL